MFAIEITNKDDKSALRITDTRHDPKDVFVNIPKDKAEDLEISVKLLLKRIAPDYEPTI